MQKSLQKKVLEMEKVFSKEIIFQKIEKGRITSSFSFGNFRFIIEFFEDKDEKNRFLEDIEIYKNNFRLMKNILEIKNLNKTLNKKEVLKNVSFSVGEGEIYGFLGPNGAGKTTTMKNILRFLKPDSGEIKIFGKNIFDEDSRRQIGFMPENTYLYKHLTGKEFLKFNGKFFGLSGEKLDKKVQDLLKKLGLENAGDKFLKDYSKGMLQRVGLAQAIINEPKLLFLDEPMSGLDPIGRKMVKDLIVELNKSGTTIFFNTHILADVESICDKISIIHNGEIIVKNKKVSEIEGSLEDFFIEKVNEK